MCRKNRKVITIDELKYNSGRCMKVNVFKI